MDSSLPPNVSLILKYEIDKFGFGVWFSWSLALLMTFLRLRAHVICSLVKVTMVSFSSSGPDTCFFGS